MSAIQQPVHYGDVADVSPSLRMSRANGDSTRSKRQPELDANAVADKEEHALLHAFAAAGATLGAILWAQQRVRQGVLSLAHTTPNHNG
jgi:hypothetical protein